MTLRKLLDLMYLFMMGMALLMAFKALLTNAPSVDVIAWSAFSIACSAHMRVKSS